jgi:sugar-specific transcriptional regulator TrmB
VNKNFEELLEQLGLTNQERVIYKLLQKTEPLTVKDIGKRARILPNAAYRTLRQLAEQGFVAQLKVYPVRYVAITPQIAIPQAIKRQLTVLQQLNQGMDLSGGIIEDKPQPTQV